jgi:hypothetical protein
VSPPPPAARPGPSDERSEEEATDGRTSPFPYAEDFDVWVADETGAPHRRQHRSAGGDADR